MPDDPQQQPAPILDTEPVRALDLAKAVVALAGFVGVEWAEDTVLQVLIAVNAAILFLGGTVLTRAKVTPEKRAEEREQEAYASALAVATAGTPAPPPVADRELDRILNALKAMAANSSDVDPVAPPPPAAPPAAPVEPHPSAGLNLYPHSRSCPTCGEPVLFTAHHNQRNGRWTILPLEWAGEPDTEADFELAGGTHEAVDMLGEPAGVFPVSVYVDASTGNTWRTHPPSHFLGHDH